VSDLLASEFLDAFLQASQFPLQLVLIVLKAFQFLSGGVEPTE
jgi:hypothetical protein